MDKKDRKKLWMPKLQQDSLPERLAGVGRWWRRYSASTKRAGWKGKKKKKEKAGQLGLPDCKKSYWEFLHNPDEKQQFSLLRELSTGSISFAEAAEWASAM